MKLICSGENMWTLVPFGVISFGNPISLKKFNSKRAMSSKEAGGKGRRVRSCGHSLDDRDH